MAYKTIKELQESSMPHATCELLGISILDVDENGKEIDVISRYQDSINEYLKLFTIVEENKCPRCGISLGGLLGSFEWGLVHGEGVCSSCGYPARGYHDIKDSNKKSIINASFILPYHPDFCIS